MGQFFNYHDLRAPAKINLQCQLVATWGGALNSLALAVVRMAIRCAWQNGKKQGRPENGTFVTNADPSS